MIRVNNTLEDANCFWTAKANGVVKLRMLETEPHYEEPQTLPTAFQKVVEEVPNNTALSVKRDGEWVKWTYRQYHNDVIQVARSLIKVGLQPHHGVCIVGFNSPEWAIAYLASIYAGGLPTGLYTTSTSEDILFVAKHCEANVIIVEKEEYLEKVLEIWSDLPDLKAVVQYTGSVASDTANLYSWKQFLSLSKEVSVSNVQERVDLQRPNACCCLFYTSGTIETRKGVMLSHDNIVWTAKTLIKDLGLRFGEETITSYLPLSHVAGLLNDLIVMMINGSSICFANPDVLKGAMLTNLKVVKPTLFSGVPLVWEKVVDGLAFFKNLENPIDARPMMGLNRCRLFVSGAAPIRKQTLEALQWFHLDVNDVYGLTECSGPHSFCRPDHYRIPSVGKEGSGMLTKLLDPDKDGNGELCIYGRHVFMGYLKSENQTRGALDGDGWLLSGDIGRKDEDGFLYVIGRKKEMVVTASGERISPYPIEHRVKQTIPIVSSCMVVGDNRPFLSLLITLKTESDLQSTTLPDDNLSQVTAEWCRRVGHEVSTLTEVLQHRHETFYSSIQAGINRVNQEAESQTARVQKWIILPRDFSIAGRELGPTLNLRRSVVLKMYEKDIESLYAEMTS